MGAAAATVPPGPWSGLGLADGALAAPTLACRAAAAVDRSGGTTGTILALGTAQRTSEAFDRYLERANVGDVVVNPSVSSTEVDAVIRSLPGVTEVTTESLFMVTNDEGAPRPRRLVDQGGVESGTVAGVFGSHDGRYSRHGPPGRPGRAAADGPVRGGA